MVTKKRNKEY